MSEAKSRLGGRRQGGRRRGDPGGGSGIDPAVDPCAETRVSGGVWFYDLGNGTLFQVLNAPIPPIDAPSRKPGPDGGPGGVMAHVFSCGHCDDATSRFGYLETYTPQAKAALTSALGPGGTLEDLTKAVEKSIHEKLEAGHLVAAQAEPIAWVAMGSEEGAGVMSAVRAHCPDKAAPTPCQP